MAEFFKMEERMVLLMEIYLGISSDYFIERF